MAKVEEKLLEETNYELEINRGTEIAAACSHIENLTFPIYYKDLSIPRIITMDWMQGLHIREWLLTNPSQELKEKLVRPCGTCTTIRYMNSYRCMQIPIRVIL